MSPKLFTASDVERAARLAAQSAVNHMMTHHATDDAWRDVEAAVHSALCVVADNSPPFYSEADVKLMLQYLLEREDVEAEFVDAVATALRR